MLADNGKRLGKCLNLSSSCVVGIELVGQTYARARRRRSEVSKKSRTEYTDDIQSPCHSEEETPVVVDMNGIENSSANVTTEVTITLWN
eukprot:TRINITY_DN7188_c0_g1_i1.p1 TRINITY_DN7188_c0_g1~~TRINITY_DN7188_c0_g1_i1.p1  ORF type:complete len:89 (-),score=11.47 TRINITY_DN7188_c0_g1_i1:24-290(-)